MSSVTYLLAIIGGVFVASIALGLLAVAIVEFNAWLRKRRLERERRAREESVRQIDWWGKGK